MTVECMRDSIYRRLQCIARGRHALITAAVTASLLVRLAALGHGGPWIDESYYSVALHYGNVFYLTGEVCLWPPVCRAAYLLGGAVATRAVTALMGTATVLLVYLTARSRETAWHVGSFDAPVLAGLVFSLSAPSLFVSSVATHDAMSVLLYVAGLWLLMQGVREASRILLLASSVLFVAASCTRYFTSLYLPVALAYAAILGIAHRRFRIVLVGFCAPLLLILVFYGFVSHHHIMQSLNHVRELSTRYSRVHGATSLSGEILIMAGVAPWLGAIGLGGILRTAAREGRPELALEGLLIAGSAALAPIYHIATGSDYGLVRNLSFSLIFAALPAGLGMSDLRLIAPRFRSLGNGLLALVLAFSLFLSWRTVWSQKDWPDWTPVIRAARETGVDSASRIWSTATSETGNVWQLRADLGPSVEPDSPWRAANPDEVLRLAAFERVPVVVGPLPGRTLKRGDLVDGYRVLKVVGVPRGPVVYILKHASSERAIAP